MSASTSPGSTSTVTTCRRNFRRLRKSRIRSAGVLALRVGAGELGPKEDIILFSVARLRVCCHPFQALYPRGIVRVGPSRPCAPRNFRRLDDPNTALSNKGFLQSWTLSLSAPRTVLEPLD